MQVLAEFTFLYMNCAFVELYHRSFMFICRVNQPHVCKFLRPLIQLIEVRV